MRDSTGAAPQEAEAPARSGRVPPEVLARRRAAERAVIRLAQLKVISEAVGQTARVLILGAWPCATGRFVNTTEVNYLAVLRGRVPETIRRHVRDLERDGWVRDYSLANGGRGVVRGVRYGIDMSGLIDRIAEVEEEAELRRKEERARAEARALLKPLKGRLRRLLRRPTGAALAQQAAELLSSIPRRFIGLTLAAMRLMIDTAERLLGATEAREPVDNLPSGPTETSDPSQDSAAPTNTQEDESIRRGPAGEDRDAHAGAPGREMATGNHATVQQRGDEGEATFDIGLREAMTLLPERLRAEVEETYGPDGPRGLWLGLNDAAAVVWHEVGGDEFTRQQVIGMLGPRQGAVLLLLVASRVVRTGTVPVRDVSAYAVVCTRKAVRGAFMWGSGLRSAVRAGRPTVPT